MKPSRITVKRPVDPLRPEIDRRLALKSTASKRERVSAPVVGPEALFDLAGFVRANPVTVLIMEARP